MQGGRRPLCRWENPAANEVDYSLYLRVPFSPLEVAMLIYGGMQSGDQPDPEDDSAWPMLGFDALPDVNNSIWY
ncbi:hypothetical protein SISSUDRAFT_1045047 [Sistotremastrum suecicum HHB10207 ss-3]|uniref:Uncharacterized protein n=1 Tax=Sistotremastrum suecicum HHB10207 ss-3 TaxID=1314776 RepID=A0A166EMM3_9AGAM|nr:hypothetical protein SISSUDRAFT_1045047 [Sistotremastrum suecicum HHB10207 ss-3]